MEIKVYNWFMEFVTFPGKRGPLVFINFMLLFTIFQSMKISWKL